MKTILLCALLFVASSVGAADFSAFHGHWRFSESETFAYLRSKARNEEERAFVEQWIALRIGAKKELEMPIHSDIDITNQAIVGEGTLLMPRYDLIKASEAQGIVVARVLWHEDKNDPGDASECDLSISKVGKNLKIILNDDLRSSYIFEPK